MILGVLSDTHGNRRFLEAAARTLLTTHRADILVHLGDNYDDGEALAALAPEVRLVPGLWCAQYRDGRVKNVVTESFGPLRTAYAHADHDLAGAAAGARVALFGHTHVACIESRVKTIWVNPGHLKAPTDRGQPASYATITIHQEQFDVSIFEFSGALRKSKQFPLVPEGLSP